MTPQESADARVFSPGDIPGAYAFCGRVAGRQYGNFPVASRLVSRRLRPHMDALCAFVVVVRDFATAREFEGVRRERLLDWRRQLGGGQAAQPVLLALGETLRTLRLPVELCDEMIGAALQDIEKTRYATYEELQDYCRRCANPGGRLVLMMHGYRDEGLFRFCDALCTGLRLAGFWQDLSSDLSRDRIYIPEEDFRAHGYSEADLRMGVCNERFRELMKFQVNRARALLEQARPLPGKLRWPLSWEARVTWYGGREVLRQIRKLGFDTMARRPVLQRWDWLPLILRTVLQP